MFTRLNNRRNRTAAVVAALAGMAGIGDTALGQRSGPSQDRKAYILMSTDEMRLKWNADQGEAGRGRGEIFYTVWAYWPVEVCEGKNPGSATEGPIGGSSEFPSGSIVEDDDGNKTIEPAVVELNKMFLFAKADCPVPDYVELDVLVWEEDSNKELKDYVQKLADAVDDAEADDNLTGGIAGVIAQAISTFIDVLTKDADDPVGKYRDQVSFPNPCVAPFSVVRTVELESMLTNLWNDVDAEAEDGTEFNAEGIDPPDAIGELDLKITGGPLIGKFSAHVHEDEPPADDETYEDPQSSDLGQPDEAKIQSSSMVATPVPVGDETEGLAYRFCLDIDNDLATGSPDWPAVGAEHELRVTFNDAGEPIGELRAWDGRGFVRVGDAYDVGLNVGRTQVYAQALLDDIGVFDATQLASWVVVERGSDVVSVYPPTPDVFAPIIGIDREYSGLAPFVRDVSPGDGEIDVKPEVVIEIDFSKTMDRRSAENAITILPPAPLEFSWRGDVMIVRPALPLEPATDYALLIDGRLARDTVGTMLDDDFDGVGGDEVAVRFSTTEPRVTVTDELGLEKGFFLPGEAAFAMAAPQALPPGLPVDLYMIQPHTRINAGEVLEDVSGDGVERVFVRDDGSLFAPFAREVADGEYNLVIDADLDGVYVPEIDRVDKAGIGFFYQLVDCNQNGMDDVIDLLNGDSRDDNGNGIPDECEEPQCPADLDGDGDTDADDFFLYLDAFASGDAAVCDLDGDGDCDADDFFAYLDEFAQGC